LRFGGKPASLVVRKSESTITDLLPQSAIFINELLDHVLLPLIQPAGNGNNEKRKMDPDTLASRERIMRQQFKPSDTMNAVFGQLRRQRLRSDATLFTKSHGRIVVSFHRKCSARYVEHRELGDAEK
jgi:hypothetical protein